MGPWVGQTQRGGSRKPEQGKRTGRVVSAIGLRMAGPGERVGGPPCMVD